MLANRAIIERREGGVVEPGAAVRMGKLAPKPGTAATWAFLEALEFQTGRAVSSVTQTWAQVSLTSP